MIMRFVRWAPRTSAGARERASGAVTRFVTGDFKSRIEALARGEGDVRGRDGRAVDEAIEMLDGASCASPSRAAATG